MATSKSNSTSNLDSPSSNDQRPLHENLLQQTQTHFNNLKTLTTDFQQQTIQTLQDYSGLEITQSEIANQYLDGLKYGLPHTNGTCCSNYFRYYQNNHDLISICCADPRNPYNKLNRFLSFWSKTCLSFLLFSIFVYVHFKSIYEFIIVVLIITPYGYFIDQMATCSYFYRQNCCVKCFHSIGLFILILTSVLNLISLAIGAAILYLTKPNTIHFITQFLLSILFDQIKPLYLGIFNWILHSWQGCLCLPQVSCPCCPSLPFPPRVCPLLGFFPIKFILNLYSLGESTYHEDKEEFQEKYPDRIAIDRFKPNVQRNPSPGDGLKTATNNEKIV